MRVADVLARTLAAAGVRYAFGIPGGEILTLIDALDGAGIRFVTARHETAAGLMAEGSALASGAPGLLAVTVGPGLTNAVNAIANAYLDRVPMIVCSGTPEGRFTHQVLDQRALLQPIVKASLRVNAANAQDVIARALCIAHTHPRGPVQIELTPSVANERALPDEPGEREACATPRVEAGDQGATSAARPVEPRACDVEARDQDHASSARAAVTCTRDGAAAYTARPIDAARDVERLHAAADWLARAERPLVLAGLEAADERIAAALAQLLERWPAPLLTTYKAKGVLSEHDPRCIGAIALSPRADAMVAQLFERADVVLLVGYDPVEMRASYVEPFPAGARVIELAAAPREHEMHRADITCTGPIAPALSELALQLSAAHELWPDQTPARVRAQLQRAFTCEAGTGFSPLDVASVLAQRLPESVPLTIDTGAHRILLSQAPIARRVGQVAQSNGLCTMGYALPSAIGMSLALGGRRVVAAMGDGGFDMVLGELATLRDLALPVTLIVFDDQSLALIDMKQRASGYACRGVSLGASDHVTLARAFGGAAERVHDRAGLESALQRALERARGFSLISCALQPGAYKGLI